MFEYRFGSTVYKALFPELLRALSIEEQQDLETSIRERGIQVPILVDEDNGIIDGLHRCGIADKLGLTEIPVKVIAGLDEASKRAMGSDVNDCRRQQYAKEMDSKRRAKRMAIEKALKANPEASDRVVAEITGVSHPTVATVRDQVVNSNGNLPPGATRVGKDGKRQPAGKSKKGKDKGEDKDKPDKPRKPRKPRGSSKPEAVPPQPSFDEVFREKIEPIRVVASRVEGSIRLLVTAGGKQSMLAERAAGIAEEITRSASMMKEVVQWLKSL